MANVFEFPLSPHHPASKFACNHKHHVTFQVTGMSLWGIVESDRLQANSFNVHSSARGLLTFASRNGYNADHRLKPNQKYGIVLLNRLEVIPPATLNNLRIQAEGFGYRAPLAGVAPRILYYIDEQAMTYLGLQHIIVAHEPLPGHDAYPRLFGLRWHEGKPQFFSCSADTICHLPADKTVAFALLQAAQ